MNREQKALEIEKLKERFAKAQLAIVTDFKGLTVEAFNQLRRNLKEKNSEIKVVKNRLAKIALKGTDMEFLAAYFTGTSALTITETDPSVPAKVLIDFAKDHEAVQFKAAAMDNKIMSRVEIEALAKLPSRNQLIGQLIGSMLAPARNWVSVLAQIPRQVVNVLAAIRDQKEKEGGVG